MNDPTSSTRDKASGAKEQRLHSTITLFENGKLRRAEREFLKVLAEEVNNLDAHFELTRLYRRVGDFAKAVFHGRRVLRLSPTERNACLNLGLAYEEMGNLRLAVKYYKRELERNPFSGETLFNLGFFYFERHRWVQASKYLLRCFQTGYPFRQDEVVYRLGRCYCETNNLDAFIAIYRHYLERAPTAGWAVANLGRALLRAKDYRHAATKLALAKRLGTQHSVDEEFAVAKRLYLATARKGENLDADSFDVELPPPVLAAK